MRRGGYGYLGLAVALVASCFLAGLAVRRSPPTAPPATPTPVKTRTTPIKAKPDASVESWTGCGLPQLGGNSGAVVLSDIFSRYPARATDGRLFFVEHGRLCFGPDDHAVLIHDPLQGKVWNLVAAEVYRPDLDGDGIVAVTSDGTRILTSCSDGQDYVHLCVRDTRTGKIWYRLPVHGSEIGAEFSRDGSRLVVTGLLTDANWGKPPKTVANAPRNFGIRAFDLARLKPAGPPMHISRVPGVGLFYGMALPDQGARIAIALGTEGLQVFDTTTGTKVATLEQDCVSVSLSPDGRSLVVGCSRDRGLGLALYDPSEGKVVAQFNRYDWTAEEAKVGAYTLYGLDTEPISHGVAAPGNALVAASFYANHVYVFDTQFKHPLLDIPAHFARGVAWGSDHLLLVFGEDGVRLWDTRSRSLLQTFPATSDCQMTQDPHFIAVQEEDRVSVYQVAKEGSRRCFTHPLIDAVVLLSGDRYVTHEPRLAWRAHSGKGDPLTPIFRVGSGGEGPDPPAISSDGRWCLDVDFGPDIKVYDLLHPGTVRSLRHPDATRFTDAVFVDGDREILTAFEPRRPKSPADSPIELKDVVFDLASLKPVGKNISSYYEFFESATTGSFEGFTTEPLVFADGHWWWDSRAGNFRKISDASSFPFRMPRGGRVASYKVGKKIRILPLDGKEEPVTVDLNIDSGSLSPSGQVIAGVSVNGVFRAYDRLNHTKLAEIPGNESRGLALLTDEIAVIENRGEAVIVELKPGKVVARIQWRHAGEKWDGRRVEACRDGSRILIGDGDHLRVYSAHPFKALTPPIGYIEAASLSPDGKKVLYQGTDGELHWLEVQTGQ